MGVLSLLELPLNEGPLVFWDPDLLRSIGVVFLLSSVSLLLTYHVNDVVRTSRGARLLLSVCLAGIAWSAWRNYPLTEGLVSFLGVVVALVVPLSVFVPLLRNEINRPPP